MSQTQFETFALLELFGHQRMAGKVTEQSIGGASFIRIDVPETTKQPAFTRILNPSSIYAINPITLEAMAELAENLNKAPIQAYDIREVVSKMKKELQAPKSLHEGYTADQYEAMKQAEDDLNFEDDHCDDEDDDLPY